MNSCVTRMATEATRRAHLLVPFAALVLAACAAPTPPEASVQPVAPASVSPSVAPVTAAKPLQVRPDSPGAGPLQSLQPAGPAAQAELKGASGPVLKDRADPPEATVKPEFAWVRLSDVIGPKPAASLGEHLRKDVNAIEAHDPQLLDRLRGLWERVAQSDRTPQGRLTVLHFGDSHVQGGLTAQLARHALQEKAGNAGRGMVFPYAIAKTYSQNDYKSGFQGEWVTANSIQVYPKLPLGVSGFVAHTKSVQAGFTLDFNRQFDPGAKRIQLFYRTTAPGYTLRVTSGRWVWESALKSNGAMSPGTEVMTIEVPQLGDVIQFELTKPEQGAEDDWFELHGLSLENQASAGVLYHNLGVGGAAFASLLAQQHFESQSALLKPDLVILDWGTNDLIYKNQVPGGLEKTIVETIERVRAAHPQALILLTSVQDSFFRKKEVTATRAFAQLVRQIARDNHCLFYDWYRIAGGKDAMRTWYAYGLAQPDHIHLSSSGYAIKGALLAEAILNSVEFRRQHPNNARLWLAHLAPESPHTVAGWLKSTQPFDSRPDLIKLPKAAKAGAKPKSGDKASSKPAQKPKSKSGTKPSDKPAAKSSAKAPSQPTSPQSNPAR